MARREQERLNAAIALRLRFEANGVLLFKGRFLRDAPNAGPERTTRYVSLNLSAFI